MPIFAGQIVTADFLHNLDTHGTYTPELTAETSDPDLGEDGLIEGWWHRNGNLITGGVRLLFSGDGVNAGSGFYLVSLPFIADTSVLIGSATIGAGFTIGSAQLRDDSESTFVIGVTQLRSASSGLVRIHAEGSGDIQHNAPWTWSEGDRIAFNFTYPADPSGLP